MSNVIQVLVDCPACGNVNRKARRACTYCKRKGLVLKNMSAFPEATGEAPDA